ncbi:MAG: transcriptional repressor LexA [Treponemataceae bacterium]
MKELTVRQREIFDFVVNFTNTHSCPPTIRETAEHFNVSVRAIQDHFCALEKKNYITKIGKQSRSIRIVNSDHNKDFFKEIPIMGTVAAGKPIFCQENFEGTVTLSSPFIKPDEKYFALYVRGKSMIDAGINDGDLAVIKQQSTAKDGDIVVAFLDDSVTLKRFFKESARIRLQPENPDFNPIYTTDVTILGKLSHIIREY